MLTKDQDFTCSSTEGIVLCTPSTIEASSTFKVLQLQLARLLAQLPGGRGHLVVDGVIGPTVALATQSILLRLAQGHPAVIGDLGSLIYAPAEQAIVAVAENADALAVYIEKILASDPDAVRAPKQLSAPLPEDPIAFVKRVFTKKRVIAGVAGLAGFAGIALAAGASNARALGRVDRSTFLPDSDGSDEFEEFEEEEIVEIKPSGRMPEASAIEVVA